MILKSLLVLGAILIASSSIAFADVPDPYGRPRPRPGAINEIRQYQISRVGFFSRHASCPKDKVMLELTCTTPKHAVIFYKVLNAQGEMIEQSNAKLQDGYGDIVIYADKPKLGEKTEVIFDSVCELNTMETRFGFKYTDKPIFKCVNVNKYTITHTEEDYVLDMENLKYESH